MAEAVDMYTRTAIYPNTSSHHSVPTSPTPSTSSSSDSPIPSPFASKAEPSMFTYARVPSRSYRLSGMVCFYGAHYLAMARSDDDVSIPPLVRS